jgi:hypothetical protein
VEKHETPVRVASLRSLGPPEQESGMSTTRLRQTYTVLLKDYISINTCSTSALVTEVLQNHLQFIGVICSVSVCTPFPLQLYLKVQAQEIQYVR